MHFSSIHFIIIIFFVQIGNSVKIKQKTQFNDDAIKQFFVTVANESRFVRGPHDKMTLCLDWKSYKYQTLNSISKNYIQRLRL